MGHKRGAWSSPRWIKYSRRMRTLHPWCSIKAPGCEHRRNLQVHHLHYPRKPLPVWVVGPWNLIVACRSCHAKITKEHRGKFGDDRYVLATIKVMGPERFKLWHGISNFFWAVVFGVPVTFLTVVTFLAAIHAG